MSIYEANDKARAKLVLTLTKNNQEILEGNPSFTGIIKFGSVDIKEIPD